MPFFWAVSKGDVSAMPITARAEAERKLGPMQTAVFFVLALVLLGWLYLLLLGVPETLRAR